MHGRCLHLLLLWALAAHLTSSGVTALDEEFYCTQSPLWSFVEIGGGAVWCYSLVNPMTFEDAAAHCFAHQAELLRLDSYKTYNLPSGTEFTKFLINNGVNRIWNGYYVKDGHLKKYYPTQWSRSGFENLYTITSLFREPEPTGTSDCFEVFLNETECDDPTSDLSRRRRASESEAIVEIKERSRRSQNEAEAKVRTTRQALSNANSGDNCTHIARQINSRSCKYRLPFVCMKPALRKASSLLESLETLCDPDEFGNYNLARCISFDKESVDFAAAKTRCKDKGKATGRPRTLYRPLSQASSSYLNRLVVDALHRNFSIVDKPPSVPTDALAWVDKAMDPERSECLALILDPEVSRTVSWDCQAQLPFYVCQRHVSLPVSVASKITMNVEKPPGSKMTRIPRTNDIQVAVPYVYTVNNFIDRPSAQEKPTSIRTAITCDYNEPAVSELQTMTLVRGGRILKQSNVESLKVRRQLDLDFISLNSEESEIYPSHRLTDYYWCELNDLKSGEIRQSARVFVRAQEVEMYVASVAVTTKSPSNSEFITYSITDEQVDRGRVQSQLNGALGVSNRGLYYYRLLRARPKLNSEQMMLDFYIFNKTVGQTPFVPTSAGIASARRTLKSELQRFTNFNLNFSLETLAVRSIDICPARTLYDPATGTTHRIKDTNLGNSFVSPGICFSNGEPYVNLMCKGNKLYGAYWAKFQPNEGCNFDNYPPSPVTPTLKKISESDINEQTLDDVVKDTDEAVKRIDEFSAVDIIYFADIVQQATDIDEIPVEKAEDIVSLVEIVFEADPTVLKESNLLGNATNRILKSIDTLGDKIIIDDDTAKVRVVKDKVALEVWDLANIGDDDVIIGLELQEDGGKDIDPTDIMSLFEDGSPNYKETEAAIFLNGRFIRSIKNNNAGSDVRLSMNVFADTILYRSSGRKTGVTAVLNSKVISARVTVDGRAVTDLADNMVTAVFRPIKVPQGPSRTENSTCVFWDFSGSQGQGAWSEEGCSYNRTVEGKDVCVCDHLTNFAVLLDFYGQSALAEEHQLALSVLTIIGLSLSIFGLSITVISFILIRKLREGLPQQTLFNMALAMLASWITFLAGFTQTEDHAVCVAVAALLHYFILASFMWMLMEGVLQYLLFVKVLGNDFEHYMVKTAIPAWGLPLIPVIVVLAIDTDLYRGGEEYCWMALTPFYYAFLAPVALVMVVNIIVYILVTVNITRSSSKVTSSDSNRKSLGIRASVACFVALGLSWVFAFFAIDDARIVFQYLFTITTTIQGFLIFLIFTLRDRKVRDYWRDLCCRRGKGKKPGSSATPTATGGGKANGNFDRPDQRRPDNDSAYYSNPRDLSSTNSGSSSATAPSMSPLTLTSSGSDNGYEFSNPAYE